MNRDDIVKEALTWEGTPFKDQQCVKGLGVDCAMLCFGVAAELGMVDRAMRRKIAKYSPEWHYHNNKSALTKAMEDFGCEKISYHDMDIGDMVVFHYGNTEGHIGIVIGRDEQSDAWTLIHAVKGTIGKVVISNLAGDLERRFRKAYRFPGVK